MNQNQQSRKYLITINNPLSHGLTHDAIVELLDKFVLAYYCMADEIASTGTYHTHIFIFSHSPIRFSTVKNRFPTANIQRANGKVQENKDYIQKAGKWADTEKAETSVEGSFVEHGEVPTSIEEENPPMFKLMADINSGMSTSEIIRNSPKLAFRAKDIDILRQTFLADKYSTETRELTVNYVFGASGSGKTANIFNKHGARDIYRVTNYRVGRGLSFDGYYGQNVLVFEEFHSQVPIAEMLNMLDRYPLYLPARFNDKVACYEIVYLTSNIPISDQYRDVQHHSPETWNAFLRRITNIIEYFSDGTQLQLKEYKTHEDL